MKTQSTERKYVPELPAKEVEELKNAAKAMSITVMADNIARMKKTFPNRPESMHYFDEISNFFGQREKEIIAEKAKGKKVIGYFCMFAPIELILAADAIPVRVSSGWYDTSKLGDRIVPVEVCPVIRSTIGAKMVSLSPYLELTDAIISTLTCDGMTKLSEIMSDYKPILTMSPPRVKDSPQSLHLWKEEIKAIKEQLEKITGNKITPKKLRAAIETTQRATKAFRRLQDLRKGNPVLVMRRDCRDWWETASLADRRSSCSQRRIHDDLCQQVVVCVHIGLLWESLVPRLLVGTLDQPDGCSCLQQLARIRFSPIKIRLERYARIVIAFLLHLAVQVDRLICVGRIFHVDTYEIAVVSGACQDALHVLSTHVFVQAKPDLG